jgi:hypothetical protein
MQHEHAYRQHGSTSRYTVGDKHGKVEALGDGDNELGVHDDGKVRRTSMTEGTVSLRSSTMT